MKIIGYEEALALLKQGKIIAYPTESVYGLGCDPFNKAAVNRLLKLKERDANKGFILLIADWSQLSALICPISDKALDAVKKTWPGPVTWIFPKSDIISDVISGEHDSVAIRMTAHPIARQLCTEAPLISTSANISLLEPAINIADIQLQFPQGIDALVEGDLGGRGKPSAIYDVLTGRRLR